MDFPLWGWFWGMMMAPETHSWMEMVCRGPLVVRPHWLAGDPYAIIRSAFPGNEVLRLPMMALHRLQNSPRNPVGWGSSLVRGSTIDFFRDGLPAVQGRYVRPEERHPEVPLHHEWQQHTPRPPLAPC